MTLPPASPPTDWQAPRPQSGKAVASLACGLGSILLSLLCLIGPVASVAGLILGAIAIAETGRNGTRSGRGIAVTGIIVSTLSLVGTLAAAAVFAGSAMRAERDHVEQREQDINADRELILIRLQQYYEANHQSLGPGGPVLAVPPAQSENLRERESDQHFHADAIKGTREGRVVAALELGHLVRDGELRHGLEHWSLRVTGRSRAQLLATTWSGGLLREIEVTNAGSKTYFESRSTNR